MREFMAQRIPLGPAAVRVLGFEDEREPLEKRATVRRVADQVVETEEVFHGTRGGIVIERAVSVIMVVFLPTPAFRGHVVIPFPDAGHVEIDEVMPSPGGMLAPDDGICHRFAYAR